ncbi:hypothetical protein P9597_21995 [Aneurinibacillus migulanus]|uniref:hypothetical protein n=1 Tax=Aneurinibacillus migulanus TaxID=47500 RepID=UPI002E2007EF|nr:hypothetical protein [Aneurinibacillus migulanus]
MDKRIQMYTVEYECPVYGVVYYQNVPACDLEEARWHIHSAQPDAIIRAVSLLPVDIADGLTARIVRRMTDG